MKINISQSEWVVMEVLWDKKEATANQVVESLRPRSSWNEKTIRTLLNRLVKKKIVTFEKVNREYLYCPLVSREQCVHGESLTFLGRIGRAGLAPLLAAFVQENPLTDKELRQLRKILETKEKKL
jgi:BlaI family penicillinase repressor